MIHTTPHVAITMIEKRKRWDETAKHCPSWQFCSVLVLRSRDSKKKIKNKYLPSAVATQKGAHGSRQHAEFGGRRDSADQCFGPSCNPTNISKSGPLIRLQMRRQEAERSKYFAGTACGVPGYARLGMVDKNDGSEWRELGCWDWR